MNFVEAEAYLFSLGNEVETMKLGLENITILLRGLAKPAINIPKVQVAGTNGKGSVCAFLNSICIQAGIRTGLYMSPHLISITERIKIDGKDITEDEFAGIASFVRGTSESLVERGDLETIPTFFEQVTAIALVAFASHGLDLLILETGLGGRYDAVTAARAEIAVITRIDLDHQEYLGDTVEEIAAEKAAIIGSDTKAVVIGAQSTDALRILLDRCQKFAITPEAANRQFIWEMDFKTGKTTIHDVDREPPVDLGVTPGLAGCHQIENAYTAVLVAGKLANDFGFEISEDQISLGIENARHPGRLEYIGNVLLDGAHNPSGAKALRQYLDESARRPITLIFGAMRDKSVAEIAEILWPRAETIILTQSSNSRAMTADELASLAPHVYKDRIFTAPSVNDAIATATALTSADGLILVTGSLYLVGEARSVLTRRKS